MNKNQILEFLQNQAARPLTIQAIAKGLCVSKKSMREIKHIINQLVKEGIIICTKDNCYGMPEVLELVAGKIQIHKDGFGFVLAEKPGEKDIFVKAHHLREVQDGDRVLVSREKWEPGKKCEGKIVKILERAHTHIVGRFESQKRRGGYVAPMDPRLAQDVLIPTLKGVKVQSGQIVVVELTRYPSQNRNPEGKIIEVLGDRDAPGIDSEAVIRNYKLPTEFPDKVLREAAGFPAEVSDVPDKRRDLRDMTIFTIDGERARDFDDAVSISKLEKGGWRLGVHIADVSYYVTPGSALDKEAYERGCSVYFPDRVIPMLPEKLSNGLCSLNPNVPRLAFSAFMDFSPAGALLDYELCDSVIKSCARLTYTEVKLMIENNDPEVCQKYSNIYPTLQEMAKLAKILKQQRISRGGLDFDLPEPEIILDLQGNIQDIIKMERNSAHELIEDFMLAANRVTAAHISKMNLPFIYRIHEKPDPDKLEEFALFVKNFGYKFDRRHDIEPMDLQKLLAQIKDKPEETVITISMLRSLKLAKYDTKNVGHFGLAMSDYTHFTSPIRRYPDLIVHRLLRKARRKKKFTAEQIEERAQELSAIALQSSLRERISEKAERDIISIKRTQFMASKLGEEYTGLICGINPFGLIIELEEFYIEGLIHVNNMRDDYYTYDERRQEMVGKRTKQIYKIGEKLKVQVERVDEDRRIIDFKILEKLGE